MDYILALLEVFCQKTGMTFSEALAWLEKTNKENNNLPWEDVNNESIHAAEQAK